MTDSPTFFINGMTTNSNANTNKNVNKNLNVRTNSLNNKRNILNKQQEIAKNQSAILSDLNREQRRMKKRQKWKNRRNQRRQGIPATNTTANTIIVPVAVVATTPIPIIAPNTVGNQLTVGKIATEYSQLLDNLRQVDTTGVNATDLKTMKDLIVKLYRYIKDLNQTFTLPPAERAKYLDNLIARFKANSNFNNKLAVVIALNQNNKLTQKNYQAVVTNPNTNKPTNNTSSILGNLESVLGENVKGVEAYFGNTSASKNNNITKSINQFVANNNKTN